MSHQSAGGKAREKTRLAATQEETAAYIVDMCRAMSGLAEEQDLKFLAFLLGMAALEAAQAQARVSSLGSQAPVQSSAPGSAR